MRSRSRSSLVGLPDNPRLVHTARGGGGEPGGRPHWGQINTLNAATIAALYGPAVQAWRTTLGTVVGSSASFSNAMPPTGARAFRGATPSVAGARAGDFGRGSSGSGHRAAALSVVIQPGPIWVDCVEALDAPGSQAYVSRAED